MSKKFTFLFRVFCALMILISLPKYGWGQEPTVVVYKSLSFPDDNSSNNGLTSNQYTSTWTAMSGTDSWSISNFNNNNWNQSWTYIKCGRKGTASTGTIITSFAIDKPVKSVTITIDALTLSKINSITLYSSSDGSTWGNSLGTFTKSTGDQTVTISSPIANKYYKIEASCQEGTSNGLLTISAVKYNVETFTVTYNANGGTGTMNDSNNPYTAGETVTVLDNGFTRSGYAFSHWSTKSDGSGDNYGGDTGDNTFEINANTTLYAQWTSNYTITAQSNNTECGTVSLSGSVITGTPKTDCRYASPAYTVTSGTATVSQSGNAFTVTPSSDCTVTINFEAIPTHTATFSVNGVTSSATFKEGATIEFPSDPSDIQGKVFRGWVTDAIDGTTNVEPSYISTTTTTMGNSNVTYYAVFATATASDDPVETKTQTLQYDTWTYYGTTTDKTSYRLFGNGSYIVSSAFDLSKLSKVIVWGGSFGGSSYNSLTIGDGTNVWKSVTVSTSGGIGDDTYTGGTALTGTKALRITSTCGDGSSNGLRISKVEIYTMETPYTYSAFCTTIVVPVLAPTFSPAAGTYYSGQTVTLSCGTTDATIRYTTNGDDPTESSTLYSSAITLTETTTIKAQAFKDSDASSISEAAYTIKHKVKFFVNSIEDKDSAKDVVDGNAIGTLPTATAPNGYTFMGWTESTISTVQSSAPDTITAGNTVEADLNLNAVFAIASSSVSSDTYALVSDVEDLNDGDIIILVSTGSYKTGGTTYYFTVANGSVNSNNLMDPVDVTITENKVTSTDVSPITLVEVTGGWKLQMGTKYLNIVAGKNEIILDDDGATNTISISSDIATIGGITDGTDTRNIFFNPNSGSNPRFAYYKSTQKVISIYKQESSITYSNYCTTVYTPSVSPTVSGDVAIGDAGKAYTLTSSITVQDGAKLTVNGVLANDNPANLIIENGGQLVVHNAGVKAKVQKTTAAYSPSKEVAINWYAISSPVDYVAISSFIQGTHNVYRYNETSVVWEEYRDEDNIFTNLDNGRGYLYRSSVADIEFEGDVNADASYTYTLSNNCSVADKYKGFNLIGNPFTHKIYKGDDGAITNDYLNDGFYYLTPGGGWEAGDDNSTAINPNEAVLVQAQSGTLHNQTLEILNTTDGLSKRYDNDKIMFTVENSEYSDVAYVLFKEGHGLNKIEHRNDRIPMIYIIDNDENFAIADMPDNTSVINLGFEAMTMGKYTISLKANGQYSYMHLFDKFTGDDIDMLVEDGYTFIGSQSDRKDRFVLRLNYNAANIDNESDIFAYQSGSDIIISGEGELQIFDVTGRKVMTTTINGVEAINGLSQGVYIFRVIGENQRTQKIVVR